MLIYSRIYSNQRSDLEKLRYVVLKGWGHEKSSVAVNDLWAVNIGLQPRD